MLVQRSSMVYAALHIQASAYSFLQPIICALENMLNSICNQEVAVDMMRIEMT